MEKKKVVSVSPSPALPPPGLATGACRAWLEEPLGHLVIYRRPSQCLSSPLIPNCDPGWTPHPGRTAQLRGSSLGGCLSSPREFTKGSSPHQATCPGPNGEEGDPSREREK